MNKVILIGRMTKEPDVKYQGDNNTAVCRFNLAVQRSFKNKEGKYDADFITCTAYKSNAEFIEKYFHKGSQMVVEGEWRTGSYEKDGRKIYTNECVVNRTEFVGSKSDNDQATTQSTQTQSAEKPSHNRPSGNTDAPDDFVEIDQGQDIPFFG